MANVGASNQAQVRLTTEASLTRTTPDTRERDSMPRHSIDPSNRKHLSSRLMHCAIREYNVGDRQYAMGQAEAEYVYSPEK